MEHQEYRYIVPGAQRAFLFVHGIVGTPNHFRRLVALIPEDASVVNLLLDGHGKGMEDFFRSSMKKWVEQVRTTVAQLSLSHSEMSIVAQFCFQYWNGLPIITTTKRIWNFYWRNF